MRKAYLFLITIIFILLEGVSSYAVQDSSSTGNEPWIIFLVLFAGAFLYAIIAHKLKRVD